MKKGEMFQVRYDDGIPNFYLTSSFNDPRQHAHHIPLGSLVVYLDKTDEYTCVLFGDKVGWVDTNYIRLSPLEIEEN